MPETPLTDLASISTGFVFRTKIEDDPAGDVLVIQGKDINIERRLFAPEKLTHVHLPANARPADKLVQRNDILLMTRGVHPYATHIDLDLPPTVPQNSFTLIRVTQPDRLLPAFLAMILNQSAMQARLRRNQGGSSIPNIPISALRQLTIPLPSYQRQSTLIRLQDSIRREKNLHRDIEAKQQSLLDALIISD